VLDCIHVDSSEEEEEKCTTDQLMQVEEAPVEDEPESVEVEVFDLFQYGIEANVCHVQQVPVFFKVRFTAKTKLSLVGVLKENIALKVKIWSKTTSKRTVLKKKFVKPSLKGGSTKIDFKEGNVILDSAQRIQVFHQAADQRELLVQRIAEAERKQLCDQ
jgi:hypothetical protein